MAETGRTVTVAGARFLLIEAPDEAMKILRDLADVIMNMKKDLCGVALAASGGGKAQLVVKLTKSMTDKLNARDLAGAGGKMLGGGGGGRDDMGVAGGPRVEGTADALLEVQSAIEAGMGEKAS